MWVGLLLSAYLIPEPVCVCVCERRKKRTKWRMMKEKAEHDEDV